MVASQNRMAVELFAPIARDYERWGAILSLGQDPRWRAELVRRLPLAGRGGRPPLVLDVAAGTGAITRAVEARGARVIALDQSPHMLARMRANGGEARALAVLGTGERLPFPDATFDAVTFSYLLRYVDSPADCMRELARVLRPGGSIGMVEFGRPRGFWGPWWRLYTRVGLPVLGTFAGSGWRRVGRFLGPSIDDFHTRYPWLDAIWREAGLVDVRMERRSLGGGLLMWAQRQ